jgi:hypothetical protein
MGGLLKRRRGWAGAGVFVVLFLAGCIGPTGYHQSDLFGGYWDQAEAAPGSFHVRFLAQKRTYEFTKNCAYYRAAELAYEKGYRYFTVLKMEDQSTGGYVPNGGAVMPSTVSMPIVDLHIQCYQQRPAVACYDAYQYLDNVKVPGTDAVNPVAQRRADQAAGKSSQ